MPYSKKKNYRSCKVLVGPYSWAIDKLENQIPMEMYSDTIWISEKKVKNIVTINPDKITNFLGRECGLLVFDVHDDFMLDSLAAALGTLRGGGELILLTPFWDNWENENKTSDRLIPYLFNRCDVGIRFFQRLVEFFSESEFVDIFYENDENFFLDLHRKEVNKNIFSLSLEQKKIVNKIFQISSETETNSLVVTANRGHGKTTAMAYAIINIIKKKNKNIVLIAPNKKNINIFFEILKKEIKEGRFKNNKFVYKNSNIYFFTPDKFLLNSAIFDLLIIDEAAAIPIPVLEQILSNQNRAILSTTIYGYEGSGQGFMNYLSKTFDKKFPHWTRMSLKEPIRWDLHDPIEDLSNRVFLFNSEVSAPNFTNELEYSIISQDDLAKNEDLLKNIFNLLLIAHYQTRPSDLYQLMDAPHIHIIVAKHKETVVGIVLLGEEGGFETELADLVCSGKRRPKGHMFLQSLAVHAGLCDAPTLKLLRVIRIAVYDSWRNKGIGQNLLYEATNWCLANNYDLVGASFGIDQRILNFWHRLNFRVLRLGFKRDSASGRHSVLMAKAVSKKGENFLEKGSKKFKSKLSEDYLTENFNLSLNDMSKLLEINRN